MPTLPALQFHMTEKLDVDWAISLGKFDGSDWSLHSTTLSGLWPHHTKVSLAALAAQQQPQQQQPLAAHRSVPCAAAPASAPLHSAVPSLLPLGSPFCQPRQHVRGDRGAQPGAYLATLSPPFYHHPPLSRRSPTSPRPTTRAAPATWTRTARRGPSAPSCGAPSCA